MIPLIYAMVENDSDREFMIGLYREFEKLMYYTAQQFASNRVDVEDIVQDSVVKLIQKVETLQSLQRCKLAGYIVSTVRNTAINHLKAEAVISKHTYRDLGNELDEMENQMLPLDELLILADRRDALAGVWKSISETDRYLLEGRYILELTNAEMASQLGCKESSIRMKLTRARRNVLKMVMESEGADLFDKA